MRASNRVARTARARVAPVAGRKRSEASRRAILDATHELLERDGFDGLSIEGVAARAGVGKTTIYRWWPTKGVLAVEAFLDAATPSIAFRRTRSAKADMRQQMRALAALYRGPTVWIRTRPSMRCTRQSTIACLYPVRRSTKHFWIGTSTWFFAV